MGKKWVTVRLPRIKFAWAKFPDNTTKIGYFQLVWALGYQPLKDKKKIYFQLFFIFKLPFILSLFHFKYDQNHFKTPLKYHWNDLRMWLIDNVIIVHFYCFLFFSFLFHYCLRILFRNPKTKTWGKRKRKEQ
jgi:hypothetical protein